MLAGEVGRAFEVRKKRVSSGLSSMFLIAVIFPLSLRGNDSQEIS
jgi:hypothetical protein